MADLSADALMHAATNVFTVMAILYGLWFVAMVVISVIVLVRKTAKTKKRERGGQR
jgi:hypothetical protein